MNSVRKPSLNLQSNAACSECLLKRPSPAQQRLSLSFPRHSSCCVPLLYAVYHSQQRDFSPGSQIHTKHDNTIKTLSSKYEYNTSTVIVLGDGRGDTIHSLTMVNQQYSMLVSNQVGTHSLLIHTLHMDP